MNPNDANTQIAEALIYCWTYLICADGKIEDSEMGQLLHHAEAVDKIKALGLPWVNECVKRAVGIIQAEDVDALFAKAVKCLKTQREDVKQLAFWGCLNIAASDDEFAPEEIETMQKLMEAIDLPRKVILDSCLTFMSAQKKQEKSNEMDKPVDELRE